jgi:hypothetical protein
LTLDVTPHHQAPRGFRGDEPGLRGFVGPSALSLAAHSLLTLSALPPGTTSRGAHVD